MAATERVFLMLSFQPGTELGTSEALARHPEVSLSIRASSAWPNGSTIRRVIGVYRTP